MTVYDLPAVNASLNALSGVLLTIGYVLILNRRIEQHKKFMIAAFVTSSLFLISYVVYHAQVGSIRFSRHGIVRPIYYTILHHARHARDHRVAAGHCHADPRPSRPLSAT